MKGLIEWVPSLTSITFYYLPSQISYQALCEKLQELLLPKEKVVPSIPSRLVQIPVCYEDEFGPDLKDLAHHHGLTTDDVVAIHSQGSYTLAMMGFVPGFPYLLGLDQRLFTPRLDSPRKNVPLGSVAIADHFTGIYPFQTPGGWNLIGRTPLVLFDPSKEDPFLLRVGDQVVFSSISSKEFQELEDFHCPLPLTLTVI
jgi:inhibitor of KinA